jgi:hypothetical protein
MRTRKRRPARIEELIKAGVLKLEKANKEDRYPTIGYWAAAKSWLAWNHRVHNMFSVGSEVKVGNCAYNYERGEWKAATVADAKQMAIDFARGVASK